MTKSKRISGLITESLENVSRKLFKDHMGVITEVIGDSSGIYALYDENELYYVGRAKDLKRRVKQHLQDRHDSQWTHLSLFLVKRDEHIGDIESLLIRIAAPVGNRVKPKGRGDSKALLRLIRSRIKQKHKKELAELLPGRKRKQASESEKPEDNKRIELKNLVKRRTPIYRMYKGKEFKAVLTPAGGISFKGRVYPSPTAAALAIVNRKTVNGWRFWRIRNTNGEWVSLREYANG